MTTLALRFSFEIISHFHEYLQATRRIISDYNVDNFATADLYQSLKGTDCGIHLFLFLLLKTRSYSMEKRSDKYIIERKASNLLMIEINSI